MSPHDQAIVFEPTNIDQWEGISDLYRQGGLFGGVESKPILNFILQILHVNAGENSWENAVDMALKHNTHGPYHKDKGALIEVSWPRSRMSYL